MLRLLLLAALVFAAAPVSAADPADATWPCVQRKVERLSAGAMWPHPLPEAPAAEAAGDIDALAARLALRRVSMEQAEEMLRDFRREHPGIDGEAGFGRIFQGAFERIDRERTEIIRGIERYADKQHALSAEINELRGEMERLMAAEDKDFDRIDAIEEDLDWSERIFNDRSRALTYVCESPVLLEKRAFSLSELLREQIGG